MALVNSVDCGIMSDTAPSDRETGVLQPGQVIRPVLGKEAPTMLALKLFGLTVTSIKELDSYDDRNYLIKVEGESSNPHIKEPSPDGYVLKVTNSLDSKKSKIMAAQVEMMLFLHSRGFKVSKPEKNVHGSHLIYAKISGDEVGEEGGENIVRLLTFIPGKILHQVPTTPQLFHEVGVFVGRMDNELKDFTSEDLKQRKFMWCMENVPQLPKFLFAVKDEHRRKMVEEVLQAWQERVAPVLPQLERGFIHGDANEQNFIVNVSQDDPSNYHVDALIDFGDIQHSYYLFELSIIIMYMMLVAKTMDPDDVGGHVIAGYLTHRTLSENEWNILKDCVAARFIQSLVLGAYSILQDPDNQYLLVTATKGWELLDSFWHTPKEHLVAKWKSILKDYQEAHSGKV
ncbi:hydroxylysine kinase-like isoform X2 [Portunus trituberculatus]|uniref:hydroxylysine kinase-like isoform X2 n=1 Tax=Portunus trituberculatus TaxID=210409 RepID=UPI001E1CFC50|nr:hydroxylysine kinase-like isoform X2 [Portunus trituberculatus]